MCTPPTCDWLCGYDAAFVKLLWLLVPDSQCLTVVLSKNTAERDVWILHVISSQSFSGSAEDCQRSNMYSGASWQFMTVFFKHSYNCTVLGLFTYAHNSVKMSLLKSMLSNRGSLALHNCRAETVHVATTHAHAGDWFADIKVTTDDTSQWTRFVK